MSCARIFGCFDLFFIDTKAPQKKDLICSGVRACGDLVIYDYIRANHCQKIMVAVQAYSGYFLLLTLNRLS